MANWGSILAGTAASQGARGAGRAYKPPGKPLQRPGQVEGGAGGQTKPLARPGGETRGVTQDPAPSAGRQRPRMAGFKPMGQGAMPDPRPAVSKPAVQPGAPPHGGPEAGAPAGKPAWQVLQEAGQATTGTPAGNRAAVAALLARQNPGMEKPLPGGGADPMAPSGARPDTVSSVPPGLPGELVARLRGQGATQNQAMFSTPAGGAPAASVRGANASQLGAGGTVMGGGGQQPAGLTGAPPEVMAALASRMRGFRPMGGGQMGGLDPGMPPPGMPQAPGAELQSMNGGGLQVGPQGLAPGMGAGGSFSTTGGGLPPGPEGEAPEGGPLGGWGGPRDHVAAARDRQRFRRLGI